MINNWTQTALCEFLAEALHFLAVKVAELPASRVPGEDLEIVTLLRDGCVDCRIE